MKLVLINKKTGLEITSEDEIFKLSDLRWGGDYDGFGLKSDGRIVVFDKCGNFGHLDTNLVSITIT